MARPATVWMEVPYNEINNMSGYSALFQSSWHITIRTIKNFPTLALGGRCRMLCSGAAFRLYDSHFHFLFFSQSAGEWLEGIHTSPASTAEMLENVEQVIQFMTRRRIRMHQTTAKGWWQWVGLCVASGLQYVASGLQYVASGLQCTCWPLWKRAAPSFLVGWR